MSDGDYPASNSAKANSTQGIFLFEHDARDGYGFAFGAKSTKTGLNSPEQHHSRPFQQALKPILERFDFVKLSGFSPVVAGYRSCRESN